MFIHVTYVIQTYQRRLKSKPYVLSMTFTSDCWSEYQDLETHRYTHRTVNHTFGFVGVRTGTRTKTIKRTWKRVRAFMNPYNRMRNTCLRRGAHPTSWPTAPNSSAPWQPWNGASYHHSTAVGA
jgi:hypothetical protein